MKFHAYNYNVAFTLVGGRNMNLTPMLTSKSLVWVKTYPSRKDFNKF